MKYIIALLFSLSLPSHALTILASGQSNMCGRGTGGPSALTADSRVLVWNNANELINDGNAFISVPDFGNPPWHSGGANNLALWFAHKAASEMEQEVRLVLVCRGARSLETWGAGQEMYEAMERIYLSTGEPPADVFLWHQGESDIDESACWYKTKFLNLLSRMRADGLLKYDAPAIVGTIAEDGDDLSLEIEFNSNLYDLATAHPDILFVNADGLGLHDTKHFSGWSLYQLGIMYWEKYSQ
jgi:hypothetical protein